MNTTISTSLYTTIQNVVQPFVPSKILTGINIISTILQPDFKDIIYALSIILFIWFASTNIFSLFFSGIFFLIKKVFLFIIYNFMFILILPFRILYSICIRPKRCNACREHIDLYSKEQIRTCCCKNNYHEKCFIEGLAKAQLICPGCSISLHPRYLKYNLKAGLQVLEKKKRDINSKNI